MASTPRFGSTPQCGTVQLTNTDGTSAKDVANFTPVAAGTRVKEIRCFSGAIAPGGNYAVAILVNDGTDSLILDVFTLNNNPNARQGVFRYDSLILPQGYKLQVQVATALASSARLDFIVEGEDLT